MARGSKTNGQDKTGQQRTGQNRTGQDKMDLFLQVDITHATKREGKREREEEANRFPVSSFHLTSTVQNQDLYCSPSRMAGLFLLLLLVLLLLFNPSQYFQPFARSGFSLFIPSFLSAPVSFFLRFLSHCFVMLGLILIEFSSLSMVSYLF